MATTTLNPYVTFDGNAKEAMGFYQSIFGGELNITTFGESPMDAPPEAADLAMHIEYHTDWFALMASDRMPGMEVTFGTSFQLALGGTDEAKLTGFFNALSEGGTVTMPMEKQFWGDNFGMLTDKFGIQWMVSASPADKPAADGQ
jgi:PhnB protein